MRRPPVIETYGAGGFRIDGVRHVGAVLILDDVVTSWRPTAVADLGVEDLAGVLAAQEASEFLLLGVGARMVPAPRPLRDALQAAGLGLEVMSTPEACRLYNILCRDGRRVATGLLPAA